MELLVFGHAGAKVFIFPTRGGRFFEYENLRLVDSVRRKLEAGALQLYCLDSIDTESFYCWWAHPSGRLQRHLQFEQYVLEEVLPLADLKNPHPCRIAHGCSLGAFHAANIAFRHPHKFTKLLALSGRFDLTLSVETFGDLLDGFYNEDVYFNTPAHFLPGLSCPQILGTLRQLDVTLVIGEEDPFRANNEFVHSVLLSKGIPARLIHWHRRAHRAHDWRGMNALYL